MWRLPPLPLLPLLLHTAGLSLAGGDDRFFPKYHARLHAGHNNDPNGPMRYNGVYHLFLQQTFPWDQDWNGGIGWGHLVSRDLAHWQEIGKYTGFVDPLVPGRWLDPVRESDGRLLHWLCDGGEREAGIDLPWRLGQRERVQPERHWSAISRRLCALPARGH